MPKHLTNVWRAKKKNKRKKRVAAIFYTLSRAILIGSVVAYTISLFGHGNKRDFNFRYHPLNSGFKAWPPDTVQRWFKHGL